MKLCHETSGGLTCAIPSSRTIQFSERVDRVFSPKKALFTGLYYCGRAPASARGRGFSLIEMLVALVVLSLSLGALYQAAMGATRNVRVAAEYTDAVMLAESMLANHGYITEQNYGASGQFGQYDWQVSSWPADYQDGLDKEQRAVAPQPLQYVEVVVSWPGPNAPRSLDLITVVPLQEVVD